MGKLAYRLWKQTITIKLERMCDSSSSCLVVKESIKDGWRSLSVCLGNACKGGYARLAYIMHTTYRLSCLIAGERAVHS